MKLKKTARMTVLACELLLIALLCPAITGASDHDDGEVEEKSRNVSLTDLYVFREKDQNPNASETDLIFVMNTNPRSLARQQYYFSNNAKYEFHVTRVPDKNATPTGKDNLSLEFTFGAPDGNGSQAMTVTAKRNGAAISTSQTTSGAPIVTTPLNNGPIQNTISMGGATMTVFAGLREDPFFFDVEQFFRVRAGALGRGPAVGFRDPSQAVDFTKGYNVNTIVVRVPKSFLQLTTPVDTFDVWETISIKDGSGNFKQFERLARPAINEGLIVTNDFLTAFNSIPPTLDLSDAAAPVRAEAVATLNAVDLADGNDNVDPLAIAGAFLPDVMRIDTTVPSGYANALNAKGSPIAGRKLGDDVIDITLSVLVGSPISDNVSYTGTPGNPAQGHKPLEPNFPYLAPPN
ncbi:MAG: DUF4331 domain-containing protein [Cyanobacteriota bacterium]